MCKRLPAVVIAIVTALFAFTLIGCGGGTTGTGIKAFDGSVSDSRNAPVARALVTLVESGDSDTTAADGSFRIEASLGDEVTTVSFLVEPEGSAAATSVAETLPPGVDQLSVTIRLTEDNEALVTVEERAPVEPSDGITSGRTPTPAPAIPHNTPAAVPPAPTADSNPGVENGGEESPESEQIPPNGSGGDPQDGNGQGGGSHQFGPGGAGNVVVPQVTPTASGSVSMGPPPSALPTATPTSTPQSSRS